MQQALALDPNWQRPTRKMAESRCSSIGMDRSECFPAARSRA